MRTRLLPWVLLIVLCSPAGAWADVTAFLGSTPGDTGRSVRGLAIGAGLLIVGVEFEYAQTGGEPSADGPARRTGMGNLLLQTPLAIGGVQPYLTTGVGLYRERTDQGQETHVGVNVGGGAKITVAGPLRLRVDYRVFSLRGQPVTPRVHRVYVGANLRF